MRVLVAAAALIALPGLTTAAHLGLLAAASLFHRPPVSGRCTGSVRLLVVVPAHNEEDVIDGTLRALRSTVRPGDAVLVVADRCTDATAGIARSFGFEVLERPSTARPGRAASVQDALRAARHLDWDAVVMVDADSVVGAGFLDACARAVAAGAAAAQARSEAAPGRDLVSRLTGIAMAVQGVLLPRGRERLGLWVRMFGSGMILRRDVAETCAFRNEGASEDLWLSLDLGLSGIRPRYAHDAVLRSANAPGLRAAGGQRTRWEAGRIHAARHFVPRLLRSGTAGGVEAAVYLLSPPFALAALSLAAGTIVAGAAGHAALVTVLLAAGAVLAAVPAVALVESRAGAGTWLALLTAPLYVGWKAVIQVRAVAKVRRGDLSYAPTPRARR